MRLLARAIMVSVPGTTGAGVSLLDARGKRTSSASTDEIVTRADTRQYELGQCPCLTAWASKENVIVQDITTDPRWPHWSKAVKTLPVRSVASAPLLAGHGCIGALKV
ncbi:MULTISPECIES: GAF domain-containing protein [unclassified Arthrobacter]|uniref:GAF domain-containing protein n=1 Tax=unclassified Arthrobacter TaxID=235627 RepID=UPI001F409D1B|nr:GAF domain-containing protein [Arthrobacter sp. FW305-BF8]UKA56196.1 GAF domain-containing protein [Arthrobacter sp. FW305-BF8]